MTKKLFFFTFVLFFLMSCSDKDKKIIGTWERTVTENDGGKYLETYTFYDEKNDKRIEYSYVPHDYSHIGYKANGRWDLDLIGNLELYIDPGTTKAVYNFDPDEWQKNQINLYISSVKLALSRQLKEMEDASIGLEISDNIMVLETLSGKDRFHRVDFLFDTPNN